MQKRDLDLKQESYQGGLFSSGNVIDRLNEQWSGLYAFEHARRSDDVENLRRETEALDVDLMRTSMKLLQRTLREVATHDGAVLLQMCVLDMKEAQDCAERWVDWLGQGECWPMLADRHWHEIQSEAEDLVIKQLEDDGVALTSEAKSEICEAVRRINLIDLIPKEAYDVFFPAEGAEDTQGVGNF